MPARIPKWLLIKPLGVKVPSRKLCPPRTRVLPQWLLGSGSLGGSTSRVLLAELAATGCEESWAASLGVVAVVVVVVVAVAVLGAG
jgi:hypothetical protein